ncbi:MAG: DNA polymerase III subunit alpha [Alphaproteobacteria bacterium]|nr:DNA polymerase III subunit alpha [Alphaproteobacteria bacterium]
MGVQSKPSPKPTSPKLEGYSSFVHLRVRSAYSLLEGAVRPQELASLAREMRMPAVAVTDTDNLFGVYEIADTLSKAGVQPIVGVTLSVDLETAASPNQNHVHTVHAYPSIAILVKDDVGYVNLSKLLSSAYLDVQPGDLPHASLSRLCAHAEGLICLTGGPRGPIDRLIAEGQPQAADAALDKLSAAFSDRLYVELQRHGLPNEAAVEEKLIDLAYAKDLPLVATNDVHFCRAEMYEAHDALLCIAEGTFIDVQDRRRLTPEHRFKSAEEMAALFSDLPEAIANTMEIAQRCAYRPKTRTPILPQFVPESGLSPEEELRAQARAGLKRRLSEHGLHAEEQLYWDRLEFEFGVIIKMGFPGYFLIVSDFMKWTRGNGIPVGVRGSGAASLVAWALDITNLDPLRFGLVFERFLNPERISMPDFDIDFCQERRDEVVRYVQGKYGRDRVGQIIALGSLQARAAVRDVGRVMQLPFGLVDRLAKLIPNPPGKHFTLGDARAIEPRLNQIAGQEDKVPQLFAIVEKIEGFYRHASTHPAGLVIGDRPLDEIVPLYRDPRSEMPVTQFDYEDAEKAGLVKFDFLGLKTLTVIAKTEELLKARGVHVDTQHADFGDVPTFEMLARGECVGVFQLESQGMRDLIKKLKPDHINDLVALVALYRPGPMDSIPKYIACKHGREKPDYLDPLLEPILSETFGVMTYQEDVMQIARELAGYTMGEADLLRRAMGKKIASEMAQHRQKFIDGGKQKNIAADISEQIFEQAAKFAGYGFNKGHAAAYAQVAYQTAYLKANYPIEFLAASMTLDIGNTDRLNVFRQEAARLGIEMRAPDINRSLANFACDAGKAADAERLGGGTIYYALAAVKNVGRQAMDHVVAVRDAGGPFRSIADFAKRIDPKLINKRAFESLVRAGAFDALNKNRKQLVESVDIILGSAARNSRDRDAGQESLFGGADMARESLPLTATNDWPVHERLTEEFSAIGFYLSGHPLDSYAQALKRLGVANYVDILNDARRSSVKATVAGTVIRKQERRGRNGEPFAFIALSDPSGMFEVMVFSEALNQARSFLEAGRSLLVRVVGDWMDGELKLRAIAVEDLDAAAANAGEGLRIRLTDAAPIPAIAAQLTKAGKGLVTLVVPGAHANQEVEIAIPKRVQVTPQLKSVLQSLKGVAEIETV